MQSDTRSPERVHYDGNAAERSSNRGLFTGELLLPDGFLTLSERIALSLASRSFRAFIDCCSTWKSYALMLFEAVRAHTDDGILDGIYSCKCSGICFDSSACSQVYFLFVDIENK